MNNVLSRQIDQLAPVVAAVHGRTNSAIAARSVRAAVAHMGITSLGEDAVLPEHARWMRDLKIAKAFGLTDSDLVMTWIIAASHCYLCESRGVDPRALTNSYTHPCSGKALRKDHPIALANIPDGVIKSGVGGPPHAVFLYFATELATSGKTKFAPEFGPNFGCDEVDPHDKAWGLVFNSIFKPACTKSDAAMRKAMSQFKRGETTAHRKASSWRVAIALTYVFAGNVQTFKPHITSAFVTQFFPELLRLMYTSRETDVIRQAISASRVRLSTKDALISVLESNIDIDKGAANYVLASEKRVDEYHNYVSHIIYPDRLAGGVSL